MDPLKALTSIPDEIILSRIFNIRNKKVMIDSDLALLYGVTTKRLNESVKRNANRFPGDFMFQLNSEEKKWLLSNYPHLEKTKHASALPYVFTEHGAVMLASVLNSERAIKVNIQIVRIFTRMREMTSLQKDLIHQLDHIENQLSAHDNYIRQLFDALKKLLNPPAISRNKVGYKTTHDH
jgi:phage regulator Rha-like protein